VWLWKNCSESNDVALSCEFDRACPNPGTTLDVSINFAEAHYLLRIRKPSRINEDSILIIENGRATSSRSIKLEDSGTHHLQIYPDNASRQRWEVADRETFNDNVRGDVVGS
jgi:hypothetical protein